MRREIAEIVRERGIPFLTHFTRLDNLPSILAHGLLPRASVDAELPCVATNDAVRLDGRRGYNCLSISFPNSPMFYRFRQDNPGVDWAILLAPPLLLTGDGVLFCRHNAADARISRAPAAELTTPESLRTLFDEIPGHPSRAEQRLKAFDPTDVQAEILVPGAIPADQIKAVVFSTRSARDAHTAIIGDRKPYISDRRGLFATREYYRTWGAGAA